MTATVFGFGAFGFGAAGVAQGQTRTYATAHVRAAIGAPKRPAKPLEPLRVKGPWRLVLNSQFAGTRLNTSIWRSGWFGTGTTGPINSNEIACYASSNAVMRGDGALSLSLTASPSQCGDDSAPYTGAVISTNPDDGRASGGFTFTYGLVQVRLYVPALGSHVLNWPAVMTLGQSWPADGEDDILEGVQGTLCHRFHSSQNVALGAGGCLPKLHGGWYTVAADFEPGLVTWYYNGVNVGSTREVTNEPMYLVIAYTASGKAPQLAVPAALKVAYVRVWQHPQAIAAGTDSSQF